MLQTQQEEGLFVSHGVSIKSKDCSAYHLSFKSQQQDISTVGKMKTLICLVLCALVASTYAAPASLEEMQAQLRKMQQHAEIEGFFSSLKNIAKKVAPYAKKGLDLYNKVNGGAEIQDDDDDDDIAQMEAYLSNLQRQAEIEGWFDKLKDVAKKVAPYAKKGLDIYNKVNGGAEIQDDDEDDDIAQMEAYLSNLQRQAAIEGWFDKLKDVAKKVAPYAKKGLDIYNKVNGGVEMQDDDEIAQLQAFLSNMNEAELQSFWKTAGKIGKFGLNMLGKK